MGDIVSGTGFWPFWLRLPGPGPTARWKYFAQVFIGTRLKSESSEALIRFLAFLVQKFWPTNHQLKNLPKIGNFILPLEPEKRSAKHVVWLDAN